MIGGPIKFTVGHVILTTPLFKVHLSSVCWDLT